MTRTDPRPAPERQAAPRIFRPAPRPGPRRPATFRFNDFAMI